VIQRDYFVAPPPAGEAAPPGALSFGAPPAGGAGSVVPGPGFSGGAGWLVPEAAGASVAGDSVAGGLQAANDRRLSTRALDIISFLIVSVSQNRSNLCGRYVLSPLDY
jgi:hypothetical protein